jgi:hypothetical protein
MAIGQGIAQRVEALPPEPWEQVLRFGASLADSAPKGERGAALRQFGVVARRRLGPADDASVAPIGNRRARCHPAHNQGGHYLCLGKDTVLLTMGL